MYLFPYLLPEDSNPREPNKNDMLMLSFVRSNTIRTGFFYDAELKFLFDISLTGCFIQIELIALMWQNQWCNVHAIVWSRGIVKRQIAQQDLWPIW